MAVLASWVVLYAWKCLAYKKLWLLFAVTFILMSVSVVYDPASDSRALLWARHIPVYIGEIFFYYFITSFSRKFIELEDDDNSKHAVELHQNLVSPLPIIVVVSYLSSASWFNYITDEGLPHILILPLFVVVVSLVRLRLAIFNSEYLIVTRLLTLAFGAIVMIHISEFMIESQKIIPPFSAYMNYIEPFWYLVGVFVFCYALSKFKGINSVQKK